MDTRDTTNTKEVSKLTRDTFWTKNSTQSTNYSKKDSKTSQRKKQISDQTKTRSNFSRRKLYRTTEGIWSQKEVLEEAVEVT